MKKILVAILAISVAASAGVVVNIFKLDALCVVDESVESPVAAADDDLAIAFDRAEEIGVARNARHIDEFKLLAFEDIVQLLRLDIPHFIV